MSPFMASVTLYIIHSCCLSFGFGSGGIIMVATFPFEEDDTITTA